MSNNSEPAYLPLANEAHKVLIAGEPTILDLLDQPGTEADFEFDPPRLGCGIYRAANLS